MRQRDDRVRGVPPTVVRHSCSKRARVVRAVDDQRRHHRAAGAPITRGQPGQRVLITSGGRRRHARSRSRRHARCRPRCGPLTSSASGRRRCGRGERYTKGLPRARTSVDAALDICATRSVCGPAARPGAERHLRAVGVGEGGGWTGSSRGSSRGGAWTGAAPAGDVLRRAVPGSRDLASLAELIDRRAAAPEGRSGTARSLAVRDLAMLRRDLVGRRLPLVLVVLDATERAPMIVRTMRLHADPVARPDVAVTQLHGRWVASRILPYGPSLAVGMVAVERWTDCARARRWLRAGADDDGP